MTVQQLKRICLREPLVVALALSLAGHAVLFLGAELGVHLGWWRAAMLPSFMRPSEDSLPKFTPPEMKFVPDQQVQRELPMLFVDVDPMAATAEAPKEAKNYAALNSKAANADIMIEDPKPNITGKQTEVLKPTPSSREKSAPLQPVAPPVPKEERTTAPVKPQEAPKKGETAMSKPANAPTVGEDITKRVGEPVTPAPERPRTLAAARAMANPNLSGVQTKQEGGVKRRAQLSAVDAKGTPLGAYDYEFIMAVQNCWYQLIDDSPAGALTSGRVQVRFQLHNDGSIRSAKIASSSVGEIATYICQRAIEKPAPYRSWPEAMRQEIGANQREITFTFHYF
jgi:hypothetical protein